VGNKLSKCKNNFSQWINSCPHWN